ncbi:hypothetical protein [Streptomyces sp. ADI98-10]|uniref:hypothetical protein n=1 Tax=Streptomyces sp. ADI98-10 TaxID=1522763 RepID=UPI000F54F98C|nr:hypothetical protein [Streptomyces sp. ADI98-10]RPK77864.1 hypothetical protein EES46_34675 [Streptomyces sp. ADI98-10]
MSADVTGLLASIDDVLESASATAPAAAAVPAAVPAPAAPVEPVELPRRSTVTDVPYEPVGPAVAQRLVGTDPASVQQREWWDTRAAAQEERVRARLEASEPAPVVEPPAPSEPAPPVELPTVDKVDKAGVRARLRRTKRAAAPAAVPAAAVPAGPNPRWRWLCFNGGAAGAGHLALWSLTGDPMAGADLMGRMTLSVPQLAAAGLAVGAAYGGWKAAGYLSPLLPARLALVARPVAAVVGGLWGQGTAPLVRDVLDAVEPWGTLLSPLLAVAPIAAACWYGIDRRAAAAHLIRPVRWALRIPLATVVASSLLYTPGALL